MLFHRIEDCFVILRAKGVFRQAPVFRRDKYIYARLGGGFIRLLSHGATTGPSTHWGDLTESPEVEIGNDGGPRAAGDPPVVKLASRGVFAA